jgi:N utilization substance protein B
MGSRRAARELALQYLFSHEFTSHEFTSHESEPQQSVATSKANVKPHLNLAVTNSPETKTHVKIESPKQWLEQYASDFEVDSEVSDFAEDLCNGVIEHKAKIDPIIQSHSAHWKISRMSLVDINILRVAVFEMHFSSHVLEPKIVMNEAIDIAKVYGTVDSGAFVNGIIDQIAKSLRK